MSAETTEFIQGTDVQDVPENGEATENGEVTEAKPEKEYKTPEHARKASSAHQLAHKRLKEAHTDEYNRYLAEARIELGVQGREERKSARSSRTADMKAARALYDNPNTRDVALWPENLRDLHDKARESFEKREAKRIERESAAAAQNGEVTENAE